MEDVVGRRRRCDQRMESCSRQSTGGLLHDSAGCRGRARAARILPGASAWMVAAMLFTALGRGDTQDPSYFTIPQLDTGQQNCHVQETQARCEDIKTRSFDMIAAATIDESVDPFIFDATFENACQWNPLSTLCEYRCVWNYKFQSGVISDRMDNIREPAHYIYEQYGSGCTGFNLFPLQNDNKVCHICADITFNPPECFLSGIDKDPDCITRCNMLPNCTSVCTSVLLLSPQYASETDETAYMDCCVPMRQQINGENALMAREQCCRDWYVVQGISVEEARVRCCNTAALEDNFPPYCAQEICHFKILEQNMSKIRDIWVQEAVGEALENDCTGADCGIVGEVTLASDGVLGSAMVNNQLLQAEGPARQGLFFDSVDQSVIFDAILDSSTVLLATGIDTPYPTSVRVQQDIFRFNVYFKECSVVKPCQLQEGVLWDQYKLKYDILLRALLASGRHPSQVEEINYREDARKAWEDSLPPYVPNVNSFNVPKYVTHPGNLPMVSALDHYNARLATRRRADGDTRAMEYGPLVGVEVVAPCTPEPGVMCMSGSGARKMNQRRSTCRATSLWRPDEVPYHRPAWRIEQDTWMSSYGPFGQWREDMYEWRRMHIDEVDETRRWLDCYNDPDTCSDVVDAQ